MTEIHNGQAVLLGKAYEQTVRVRADPIPQIRSAGHAIMGIRDRENADFSIRQELHDQAKAPPTPESLKKFRKGYVNAPGTIQKHWGLADDSAKHEAAYSYGKPTYISEKVDTIVRAQNMSGLADKFNDIKENKYASKQREPLGKGFTRSYDWPAAAQNGNANFGKPTQGLESAKEMLYPAGGAVASEDVETHNMYRMTHGNYAPGEQRSRDYNWKFDQKEHCFGYAEKKVLNGAQQALQVERSEEAFPKTIIVKKTLEDHKAVAGDNLGRVKNLGQGQQDRGQEWVHGARNLNDANTWNAARCIHGEPTAKELLPDHDLGKSVKKNCRNVVRKEEDKYRSFGCPTIRHDIPGKAKRSVADYQNYGDEPEAVDLLFPTALGEIGVGEGDFRQLRTRDQIKALFEKIGFTYKIGKFNAMYNRAKEIASSADDRVCVRDFQIALSELHQVE